MYFQKDIETMPRADIEKMQLERLQRLVKYCYDNVPFYHKRLSEAGVCPEKIKTLSDIQYIPYTTKADMRDNYPYGLFAVPQSKIVRMHASSGTTGKPTVVGYTANDLDHWSDCVARLAMAAGADENTIVQICFGYGLFTGALGLHYGLEKIGATVVPSSSGNTEKQIMLMQDFGTNALVATPSYAQYIGELAREKGVLDKLQLKLGLFGSEGCTIEMRSAIEKTLNLFATDNYGMSELNGPGVSGECRERCGMHINEDHYYAEIIDPATGDVLPRGSEGELVVTTLTKEGMPVLRYRTKDITKINYEKCACGRTFARMDKPKGRSDDMLKIRGVNVFPSQIETVLMSFKEIAPHYQLVLTRENFADHLEIKVELLEQYSSLLDNFPALSELHAKITKEMKIVLGIQTKLTIVGCKTLERFQGKAKRIVDLRNQ
ncbi:phenylacetate--CoA ligase family protein [Ruminococcus sp. 210702-SL.1.03]|jgi:phenylacetate-CoA ligase|uniref:phenylacetate--CoA ligase family protein n=1 Tax=Ruminococcus sp. 210702-SL.1.03 TaxID=2883233 RepID=UPI001D08A958|nr:phenylacetate--CoA ligase [Ruminococcus sp. 210702-SL.1.03]MCB6615026.1 phenylacetate--CoA ligase [Ruminococcus sp. 210702-SL.1.03]